MLIWILYCFVALILTLLVFPYLRLLGLNKFLSGCVTLIAIIGGIYLTNIYIAIPFITWTYEHDLIDDYPFIAVVKEKSPQEFNEYIDKFKMRIHHNLSFDMEMRIYNNSLLINDLLIKYGPQASNESINQFFKKNLDYDKVLFAINPAFLVFHEFPEKFNSAQVEAKGIDADDYFYHLFNYAEPVILSGINQAQALPTPDEEKRAKVIFQEIIASLNKAYGANTVSTALENPQDSSNDKKLVAKIVIDFYEKILILDKEKSALLLRVMLRLNSAFQPDSPGTE